jgi:hypothetical protein
MSTTTQTTRDAEGNVTGTVTTVAADSPTQTDSAYIYDKKLKKWVQPPKPNGNGYVWIPNQGWTTQAAQSQKFGYNLALINSVPELKSLFAKFWKDELAGAAPDQSTFTDAIQRTNWYKSRTTAQREYDVAFGTGKGSPQYNTLQEKIAQQTASVRQYAQQEGVQLSDADIKSIGIEATRNGYTSAELNGVFSKYLESAKGGMDGFFNNISGTTGVGADKTAILQWAKDNGVSVSDSWVAGQADEILKGSHDVQKSKDYITSLAKLAYPAHAQYLDSKTSVMDRAQTYAQKISSMLEVPYEQVDLKNQHLQNAMQSNQDGSAKNITQIEQQLRGTADWAKTNNAKETTNSIVNNILNKFGLM